MSAHRAYTVHSRVDLLVHGALAALLWTIGLAPAVRALVYQRTFMLDYEQNVVNYSANQGGLASWVDLGIVGLVLGLGGTIILIGLTLRQARLPKAGLGLWLGALLLALGPLLSARFGLHPDLSLTLLGLPFAFTAIYVLPPVSLTWFVRQAKRVLLLYAYGSLLTALVVPRWAVEYPYDEGIIPGFEIRLHGLASHANGLGPLLLIYFILSWFLPARTRWESLHQVTVLLALALTQSKTTWILLVLAYLVRLAYALRNLPWLPRYSGLALLGAAFSGGVLYLATGPAWLDSVEVFFSREQFTTLTGRTLIWQVTLNLWEHNPWFGYGPNLWDLQMGLAYAPIIGHVARHAHSEIYQSLGQSGIIGVTGLLLYATTLLAYGVRYAKVTGGVTLALVSVILLRGITEPSLYGNTGDAIFCVHFLTFTFLILASRNSLLDEEPKEVDITQSLHKSTVVHPHSKESDDSDPEDSAHSTRPRRWYS